MRVVKKHDERRNEILNAAEKLFAGKGYMKTTINDIYRFLVNRYNRKSGRLSLISNFIEEKEQGKWGFI